MNWLLGCTAFLASFVTIFAVVEMRAARSGYQRVYDLLVRDRDAARAETLLFRKLLFPQLDRVVAPTVSRTRPQGDTPTAAKLPTSGVALSTRVPWRIRFKQAVAAHNSKQISTDKLAQAIAAQQPQPAAKDKQ